MSSYDICWYLYNHQEHYRAKTYFITPYAMKKVVLGLLTAGILSMQAIPAFAVDRFG
jgi:hypothetical protein